LHLLCEGVDLVDAEAFGANQVPQLLLSRRSLNNPQNGVRDILGIARYMKESAVLIFAGICLTALYVSVRAWSAPVTIFPNTGVS
jgi:hypothetical protein